MNIREMLNHGRCILLVAALSAVIPLLAAPQLCRASLIGQSITVGHQFDDTNGSTTGPMSTGQADVLLTFGGVGSSDGYSVLALPANVFVFSNTFTLVSPERLHVEVENLVSQSFEFDDIGRDTSGDLVADDVDGDGVIDGGNLLIDLNRSALAGEVIGVSVENVPLDWTISPSLLSPNSVRLRFVDAEIPALGTRSFDIVFDVVPEPSSITLAGLGFAALGAWGWRRRKARVAGGRS